MGRWNCLWAGGKGCSKGRFWGAGLLSKRRLLYIRLNIRRVTRRTYARSLPTLTHQQQRRRFAHDGVALVAASQRHEP